MKPVMIIGAGLWLAAAGVAAAQSGPTQDELNAAQSDVHDWLYATHDYTGQRYVATDKINAGNAAGLQPLCMYQLGEVDTFQSNGIVYDGVLYTSTPTGTYAIDAATCAPRWRHIWQPQHKGGIASQRGLALKDGVLVRGTPDGYLIALNAATGEVLWQQSVVAEGSGDSVNGAPLIYDDMVIVGPAGTYSGWLAAFDLKTGARIWKFDTMPLPGEPGRDTWGTEEQINAANLPSGKVGGASVWTVMSLDQPGRLYVPIGNANPAFYGDDRPGANLYTNSVLVLDVHTGKLLWYYQMAPHDVHNWDTSQTGPLFSASVNGSMRNLLAATGKSGVLQIVDRDSHDVLFKVPVTTQDHAGEPLTPEGIHMCPGYLGGVQWNGPAYNPGTGLLYVPSIDWCATFHVNPNEPRGGGYKFDPDDQAKGWLTAVDPTTGTIKWRYHADSPMIAAVTTTSGNVVFAGTLSGNFLAFDAAKGDVLYSFQTGGALAGGVITYEIGGKQYVAVMAGSQSDLWHSRGAPTVEVFGLR